MDTQDTGLTIVDDTGEGTQEGLTLLDDMGIKNVILVHADTLRSDHLPMYGYDRMTAPNLDRDDGLVIWGYETPASWTLPSTTSALLGLTPEHHGNVNVRGGDGAGEAISIAEHLQTNGFATAAFSGSRVIASDPDLSEGFDVALEIADLEDIESQSMAALWDGAEGWLDGLDPDQPFFLWFQPMDTHPPYRPQAPFRGTWADYSVVPMDMSGSSIEQLESFIAAYNAETTDEGQQDLVQSVRDVYDELILQEDDGIGKIFTWLEQTGHTNDTLVVLTSDHGETIADDLMPSIAHGSSLRPELLRVPMVLYHPSLTAGVRPCLSSNTDLAPTLVRALKLPPIPDVDGQALQDACRPVLFSSLYDAGDGTSRLWQISVTDGTYKMDWDCFTKTASLYDLSRDKAALSPLHFDMVPGAEQLWAALADYVEEAKLDEPSLTCEITSAAR